MQVGTKNRVDALPRIAGCGKVLEEGALQHVPGRIAGTRLIVADAGVDNNAPVLGFDNKGLNTTDQLAVSSGKVGAQLVLFEDLFGRQIPKPEVRRSFRYGFDDACDFYVADLPGVAPHRRTFMYDLQAQHSSRRER
tara:strand:+ start:8310 stop:8720 length:411 start_codon:yes stop_codon:yes gene_type:complete